MNQSLQHTHLGQSTVESSLTFLCLIRHGYFENERLRTKQPSSSWTSCTMAGVVALADQLCTASANGNLPTVLFLLQNGADVNVRNVHHRTPLQVVMLGKPTVVEALLAAGADPNLGDRVLGLTVTHDSAREGFDDTLRVLLAHGADANVVDERGDLPLHSAAKSGRVQAVRVLLPATADPRQVNRDNESAEESAVLRGWHQTAAVIRDHVALPSMEH
ncbi:cyclin-dependent kinase 4 inhibitor C [Stigmatopora argus]